jgi:deferrochelatase/peroxidase EfeB
MTNPTPTPSSPTATTAPHAQPGAPQSGILNRPPEHLLFAALTFAGDRSPAATRETIEQLGALLARELHSDLDNLTPDADKTQPYAETGELGFTDGFDRAHLTVTVGFSRTGLETLGVPAALMPADLVTIPWGQMGDNPRIPDSGDVALQICADNAYMTEHVLRRVEHTLAGRLTTVYAITGQQRYTSRSGRTSAAEARALIGFHDGTANLDPAHNPDDRKLVFIDPDHIDYPPNPAPGTPSYGSAESFPPDLRPVPATEPAWTAGATYMTVRASVFDTAAWDTTPLGQQEREIGRFKLSGASLDLADDPALRTAEPRFAAETADTTVPVNSHVRKAGPRRPGTDDNQRRLFRRGYPTIAPGPDGRLQRGLIFIGFARTTSTQFEFIVRGWLRNPNFPTANAGIDPLLQRDTVIAGGYYLVPALDNANKPSTWRLPPQQ